jgi:hypothetical protein
MSALMLASSVGGIDAIFVPIYIAIIVLEIAALWKVFVKAGHPGWAAIVPIYNLYIVLKIIGRPGWWILLFLLGIIPFFGWIAVFVIGIIIALDLAKSFAKSSGFAVGLAFLNFIFIPILGFGESQYVGPAAAAPRAM